jgi:hypothetical protein
MSFRKLSNEEIISQLYELADVGGVLGSEKANKRTYHLHNL